MSEDKLKDLVKQSEDLGLYEDDFAPQPPWGKPDANEIVQDDVAGCACRWDTEGDRVVTCERHEGWLEVIAAWADEKGKQAWRNAAIRLGEELSSVGPDGYYNMAAEQWLDWAMANVKSQIEFASVKMVAYNCTCGKTIKFESEHGIVAQQRTWVGLTVEEVQKALGFGEFTTESTKAILTVLARAIEAKLKEKNT
jgi:hypothetical protein